MCCSLYLPSTTGSVASTSSAATAAAAAGGMSSPTAAAATRSPTSAYIADHGTGGVACVLPTTRVLEAFSLMYTEGISAVGVVREPRGGAAEIQISTSYLNRRTGFVWIFVEGGVLRLEKYTSPGE